MKKCLVDSGPLVALFDKSEARHREVKVALKRGNYALHTTWLVVAEVGHLLSFDVRAQIDFLDWVGSGGAALENLTTSDLQMLRAAVKQYASVPMDFADASLIVLAHRLDLRRIMTFDSDFYVYRAQRKNAFDFVL